jgi:hypothetical protein
LIPLSCWLLLWCVCMCVLLTMYCNSSILLLSSFLSVCRWLKQVVIRDKLTIVELKVRCCSRSSSWGRSRTQNRERYSWQTITTIHSTILSTLNQRRLKANKRLLNHR